MTTNTPKMPSKEQFQKIRASLDEVQNLMDSIEGNTGIAVLEGLRSTPNINLAVNGLEQALTNMGKPEKLGHPDITMLRKAWRLTAACRALYTAIEAALDPKKEDDNESGE
jgi:hypothetical protein